MLLVGTERGVGSGELKQFDIIKNVVLSGEVTTEIVISDLCRPRSIQMKVPKLIGNPVPCEIVQTGKLCNKRKMGNNRGPMPRVDELFDDSVSSRYYCQAQPQFHLSPVPTMLG